MRSTSAERLVASRCVPCEGGVPRLSPGEAEEYRGSVPGWEIEREPDRIRRSWVFQNFLAAMEFLGAVARLAEDEGHHPDLHLTRYRNVEIEIWTHAIGGLSENDFILAAKIDRLPVAIKVGTGA